MGVLVHLVGLPDLIPAIGLFDDAGALFKDQVEGLAEGGVQGALEAVRNLFRQQLVQAAVRLFRPAGQEPGLFLFQGGPFFFQWSLSDAHGGFLLVVCCL